MFSFSQKRLFWLGFALGVSAAPLGAQDEAASEMPLADDSEDEARRETVITSERVEMFAGDAESRFFFEDNVLVEATNLQATCDVLEVLVDRGVAEGAEDPPAATDPDAPPEVGAIQWIELRGNVIIEQAGRRATAGRAEILPRAGRVILMDNPRVNIEGRTVTGWKMVLHRDQRRVEVLSNPEAPNAETGGRVRATLPSVPDLGYRRSDKDADAN